jgi:hypothetical protein
MKKETIELMVKGTIYEFVYEEKYSTWSSVKNEALVDQYPVSVRVKATDAAGGIYWDDVVEFMGDLARSRPLVNKNIKDAQALLGAYFSIFNKEHYDSDFLKDIVFTPWGIDLKGRDPYEPNFFLYDYSFYAQYAKDEQEDIGTAHYMASFKGHMLVGMYYDE